MTIFDLIFDYIRNNLFNTTNSELLYLNGFLEAISILVTVLLLLLLLLSLIKGTINFIGWVFYEFRA